jgi:hypothetical protein
MPDDTPPPGGNLLPALVLAVLALLLVGGWWVFPKVWAYMGQQDCIASGHLNCGPAK